MDVDEEVEEPETLEGDDFQLVLPSGVTVGHRNLMRYRFFNYVVRILNNTCLLLNTVFATVVPKVTSPYCLINSCQL